jgi:hypothetical protein
MPNCTSFVTAPPQTKEQFLWVEYAETEKVCHLSQKHLAGEVQ